MRSTSSGVTVAIPCRNGVPRLQHALQCLADQAGVDSAGWEVLLVDNASTDRTADFARESWRRRDTPLRIVQEPRAGAAFARLRAFSEARFGLVSFIDDDNLVSPTWVRDVWTFFAGHPEIAACGGLGLAAPEGPPPTWFSRHERAFAVGPQAPAAGVLTGPTAQLQTAGLTVRAEAGQALLAAGFEPTLTGRVGKSLCAGEDSELCYALRLAESRLWYEPSLTFRHVLPAARLSWSYLKQLHRGSGEASVALDAYEFALGRLNADRGKRAWLYQTAAAIKQAVALRWAARIGGEGSTAVLRAEYWSARWQTLVRDRGAYAARQRAVARLAGRLGRS